MGGKVSRSDFEWVYTDEPHASRRKEILKKYPEIKNLMGCDPKVAFVVTGMMLIQLLSLWLLKDAPLWILCITAYWFGAFINHSLMYAIHEAAHNLVFGNTQLTYNHIFGIFANLPTGIPMFATYKKYHSYHHRYQGDEIVDVDTPATWEGVLFNTTWRKVLWLILFPLLYLLRMVIVNPTKITIWEVINATAQITFNAEVMYFFGIYMLGYLIGSTILAVGLHPIGARKVAEHFMFKKGYETYSYYGPLNVITFNGGYHVEHHDFPNVPGSRLPKIKEIAKEYYEDLPHHNSWIRVLYEFIFNPDIGPYNHVRRYHKDIKH